jgi:amino acid transporter
VIPSPRVVTTVTLVGALTAETLDLLGDLGQLLAVLAGDHSDAPRDGLASLGEETDDPGRNIPRAILIAVLAAGTFYVICMVAQSLGFGLSDAGIKRFSESSGPLGDLGKN